LGCVNETRGRNSHGEDRLVPHQFVNDICHDIFYGCCVVRWSGSRGLGVDGPLTVDESGCNLGSADVNADREHEFLSRTVFYFRTKPVRHARE
jgi:hypothetical protein